MCDQNGVNSFAVLVSVLNTRWRRCLYLSSTDARVYDTKVIHRKKIRSKFRDIWMKNGVSNDLMFVFDVA